VDGIGKVEPCRLYGKAQPEPEYNSLINQHHPVNVDLHLRIIVPTHLVRILCNKFYNQMRETRVRQG